MKRRNVFICHASADKEDYVRPFVKALDNKQITYWLDEAEILWGDRITDKINEGISMSQFVVVFLTESFLKRRWPQAELNSALHFETSTGKIVVLPIMIAQEEDVFSQYPLLRDKLFLRWTDGINSITTSLESLLGKKDSNHFDSKSADYHTKEVGFSYRDAPGISGVYLIGSFNGWNNESHKMAKKDDGNWHIRISLPRGVYFYKYYVTYEDGREEYVWDPSKPTKGADDDRQSVLFN